MALQIAAAVFALPFAAAFLLSQPFSPSVLSPPDTWLRRTPPVVFNIKLSQTISSSLLTYPFSISFLLFSKAYVIRLLLLADKLSSSFSVLYFRLLRTYICNSFLILSVNASGFALFFFACNLLQAFGFSSEIFLAFLSVSAAVIFFVILANALVISNLALALSAAETSSSSSMAILKACVLIRGRNSTALSLSLPTNLGLAGVEALFQCRIVKSYLSGDRDIASLVLEGMLIAYLYAIFVVLDTVANFLFYQSCKNDQRTDPEEGFSSMIEIRETETAKCVVWSKGIKNVP
ncbi:PREDICTED: uncharacterized protein LOC104818514 [Tarenaya hassleriana]|uniref:uncharacterized protein LOC104818514 n=1 Tax=Tarenaya hassleriana TaxID=28532 RepID=UPI00053C78B2|nr:PREDICTED: uncharacterized protein LOC104818514 [Tarenaya hassleriana]